MNDDSDQKMPQPSNDMKTTIREIKAAANNDPDQFISDCQKNYDWSEFLTFAEALKSEDSLKWASALIGLRKLLNDEDAPFHKGRIQKALDAGLIPKLLEFMRKDDEPQLQLEATWALCGLTGGTSDQVQDIVDKGAVPLLVRLLKSCHTELFEHAAMAIGNIAADLPHRDFLLDQGALYTLIDILEEALAKKYNPLIRQGTRALSNLCRVKPQPEYERVADATPVFCKVIQEVNDPSILHDAVWAIYYLSNEEHKVERVLEVDVVPSFIRHLDCSDLSVVIPSLQILGNIVAASDDQADVVLRGSSARSYVKKLFKLLKSHQKVFRRVVCWSLSNITCRSPYYLNLVVTHPEYIEQLANAALHDILEVQREAVWALGNATKEANKNQMISMTWNGVFDCLCKLIQQQGLPDDVIVIGLRGIENFMNSGASKSKKEATNNKILIKLKQIGALSKIKTLRKSQDSEVSELTVEIWKKYLKIPILRRKLRLKKAILCFRNERHSLFGIFQNKKKRVCV